MLKLIAKRIGTGIILIFVIATITFFLLILGSGNVGRKILGVNAPQEQVERLNEKLGLNKPVTQQYFYWLVNAGKGDFGKSWFGSDRVTASLLNRLKITLPLISGSILLAAVVSLLLGMAAAVRGGVIDHVVQGVGLIGFAIPGFLVAFGLVVVFSLGLGWFRATGYVRPSDSFIGWLRSTTLPTLSLAFASIACVSLQVRSSVKDALKQDYVRTLRSRGLSFRRVLFKHILRNAAGPALSVLGVQFVGLLGGAVIVEQIFAIPGIGQVAVTSASAGDVPMVMGLVIITAIIVVAVNLTVDLLAAWLNPKVRLQ